MDQPPPPPGFPPPPGTPPPPPGFPPPPTDTPRASHFPLDLNRVFELTFSMFRHKPRTFLGAALVVMVPVALLLGAATLMTIGALNDWLALLRQFVIGRPVDLSQFPWSALAISIALGALAGIGTLVAQMAVTRVALTTYGGGDISTSASVRAALSRGITAAAVYLLLFLVSFAIIAAGAFVGGLLFLSSSSGGRIEPGLGVFVGLVVLVAAIAALIFISVRWALVVQVMVTEGRGARASLGRSWRLVSGSSWRVLGYLIVFGLIFGLLEFLFGFILTAIVDPASLSPLTATAPSDPGRSAIVQVGAALIGALLLAFPTIGMTLLYLDLRHRRGEQVPEPGVAEPAPPPSTDPVA